MRYVDKNPSVNHELFTNYTYFICVSTNFICLYPEGEEEEEAFVVVVMGGGGGKNAFCNWGYMAFIVSDWFNSSFNIGCRISGSSWGT